MRLLTCFDLAWMALLFIPSIIAGQYIAEKHGFLAGILAFVVSMVFLTIVQRVITRVIHRG
jgi:hypothetical protein